MKQPARYALLRHECPADYRDGPHWDLMLEREGVEQEHRLATWSLLALPIAWADLVGVARMTDEAVEATELPDHRAAYLDYEGPVSGGRGEVRRVAGGGLVWLASESDRVEVRLTEGLLEGRLLLTLSAGGSWRLRLS